MISAQSLFGERKFLLIDEFVSPSIANFTEERLLNNVSFPWHASFHRDDFSTVQKSKWKNFESHDGFIEGPQLCHSVVTRGNEIDRGELRMMEPLRRAASKCMGDLMLQIDRCKYNLQFQRAGNSLGKFNCPHRDCNPHQLVMVYYVNDSDGKTYLFHDEELNLISDIASKKGRALFFPGDMLHAGQHPIESLVRCVINMNFTVYPKGDSA